jgi:heme-degrading monooxygenase HmoA
MIMSLLEFHLKPGTEVELREVFTKHQVLETAMQVKGCWKLAMVVPVEPDGTVSIVGFWEDNVAYQRWIDHPKRGASTEDIEKLVSDGWDSTAPARIMNVLHCTPNADAWSKPA